jgi:hypothetical protein
MIDDFIYYSQRIAKQDLSSAEQKGLQGHCGSSWGWIVQSIWEILVVSHVRQAGNEQVQFETACK